MRANTHIFSGNANLPLAEAIAETLNTNVAKSEVRRFNDGEVGVSILEHVRGHTAFIVQPTCAPANDNLMELLIMTDALRRSAINRIIAVVPYWGYARQDRRMDFERSPISSRLVANMVEAAGIDQLITCDLHSGQQQGFFNIPVINISASPEIVADIWKTYHQAGRKICIVSPDVGGVVRARAIQHQIDGADLAIVDKRRPVAGQSEVMHIIGDVKDATCIVVDDMIDTAGTLCNAAVALKEKGAASVAAYATHPVFSGKAYENIGNSELDEVVITDTIPLTPVSNLTLHALPAQIRQISVAGLLAETMRRVREKESVSGIYAGV